MKVALINAPYRDLYGPIKQAAGYYFPLGLGYISSVLRKNGHKIVFIDPESHGMSMFDMRSRLIQEEPELVGISCATPNFEYALKLAKMAKQVNNPVVVHC